MSSWRIVICVKAVPDPRAPHQPRIDPVTGRLNREQTPLVLNPADRFAVEEGLLWKERWGGSVTVISMGPPASTEVLRETLALGADTAILLSDRSFGGGDTLATATVLAAAVRKLGCTDVIFCGCASSDGGTGHVGPQLAALLDLPAVTNVSRVILEDNGLLPVRVQAAYGSLNRELLAPLPLLLVMAKGVNHPRPVTFTGVLASRGREIVMWGCQELSLDPDTVGVMGSPTLVARMITENRALSGHQAQMLPGEPAEAARILAEYFRSAGLDI